MILCDIGNTHFHILDNERLTHVGAKNSPTTLQGKKVYFVSVNEKATQKMLDVASESINLEPFIDIETSYIGIGIDRLMACIAIDDGVVVDAGSAITVDVVQNSMHLGGYILPGLSNFIEGYKTSSPKLDTMLNLALDIDALPQNTKDAISFGVLSSILLPLKEIAKNKNIYFTGGDGKYLAKFFDKGFYDEMLIFRGMKKTIQKRGLA